MSYYELVGDSPSKSCEFRELDEPRHVLIHCPALLHEKTCAKKISATY